jgi:hypothetical protein
MSDDRLVSFDRETERLKALALRSTDPAIVSKAIAVCNPDVRRLVADRFARGEHLAEVASFPGRPDTEIQVFFRFVAPDSVVRLVDSGILVFVDSLKGEVLGAIESFDLQPEQRPSWQRSPWEVKRDGKG